MCQTTLGSAFLCFGKSLALLVPWAVEGADKSAPSRALSTAALVGSRARVHVPCAPAPADRCPSLRAGAHPTHPPAPRVALRRPAAGYRKLSEDEGGKLGEGTFGVVAKAIKLDTNAVVAIKKLRRVGASKTGMELPTLREIMLLQVHRHLRRTRAASPSPDAPHQRPLQRQHVCASGRAPPEAPPIPHPPPPLSRPRLPPLLSLALSLLLPMLLLLLTILLTLLLTLLPMLLLQELQHENVIALHEACSAHLTLAPTNPSHGLGPSSSPSPDPSLTLTLHRSTCTTAASTWSSNTARPTSRR